MSISTNGSRHTHMFTYTLTHTQMSTHSNSHTHNYHTQVHIHTQTLGILLCYPFIHTCVCSAPPSIAHIPLITRAHPWLLRALLLSEPVHCRSSGFSLLRKGTQRILVAHVSSCGCMNHDLKRKAETQCGHDTGHRRVSPSPSPVTHLFEIILC